MLVCTNPFALIEMGMICISRLALNFLELLFPVVTAFDAFPCHLVIILDVVFP